MPDGRPFVHPKYSNDQLYTQNMYRRLIAKLGTNLLTAGTDRLDLGVMSAVVGQVARLRQAGNEVIVVTSGAITAGRHRLGSIPRRRDIPARQVLSAVGQSYLMQAYDQLFRWHDIVVAQTLLTRRDLSDRVGYLNARNTLLALLEMGVVPVVNENDAVAVEEIAETKIGDNDTLSALVANLVDADLLAILTTTKGLFTADPHLDPAARLLDRVEHVDASIEQMAGAALSDRSIGGMVTKVRAAKLATASGVNVVIVDGHEPRVLERLAGGEAIGTFFPANIDRVESRKRWMLAGLSSRGRITVDAGAARALREQNTSLLPAGIVSVEGPFDRGDAVEIGGPSGDRIGFGISNYRDSDLERIRGQRSDQIAGVLGYEFGSAAVHRNNLVIG
ncbi:MAG TPA: glutamate 5-kinase [Bryobacteraceae bacterium]|nr:glutamate 5-kinase [Bryobacteraceae bacterium]